MSSRIPVATLRGDPPTLEVLGILVVHERGKISTVIQDHVEGLTTLKRCECLLNAPQIFFVGLALPRENRNAGGGDAMMGQRDECRGSVVTHAAAAWS
jgi:hypothetical protein